MKKVIIVAAMCLATLSVSASSFPGQDNPPAAKDNARKFTQLLDTNFMRLLEIELKPGDFATVHAIPEHLAYAATPGTLLITTPDGNTQLLKVKPGDQLWWGVTTYKTVNVGKSDFKAVVYEEKVKNTSLQPQKFITFQTE